MGILDIFESDDSKRRKSHFKNLFVVAFADGELDHNELDFINKIATRLEIPEKDVKNVLKNPDNIEFYAPENEEERFAQLYELVSIMMVDGDIDEKEVQLCKNFARKLDYKPHVVDQLVDDIRKAVKEKMGADLLYKNLKHKLTEK